MELPDIENTLWLFADKISAEDRVTIKDFDLAYKSPKGKVIPVVKLQGKIKEMDYEGDLLMALWNIANYKNLKLTYGKDTSEWVGKNFSLEKVGTKIKLVAV